MTTRKLRSHGLVHVSGSISSAPLAAAERELSHPELLKYIVQCGPGSSLDFREFLSQY